ncbi:putative carbonyl reductase [Paraphoma chrysanthemicola]|nr:putative carbonyl reductase [Paraphoma chrysanthemicola]
MSKHWDPLQDMPALDGKVAVVTGGNSGIGEAIVRLLALRGAKVYFTTRSEAKAQKTQQQIRVTNPEIKQEDINSLVLDFTDLQSITDVASELGRREKKVDILIHNAAVTPPDIDPVGPGWEPHMTMGFIGPFVFINRLLPLLQNALLYDGADVRIISLSSTAQISMLPADFKFELDSPSGLSTPVTYYPWHWRYLARFLFSFNMIRFAISKAATVILAEELQRRLDEQNTPILSMAVHPGETATEAVLRNIPSLLGPVARLAFLKPDQGAATPLFAVTAKEVRRDSERYKGKFILPGGNIGVPNPVAKDERQVKGLWKHATDAVDKELAARNLPPLGMW